MKKNLLINHATEEILLCRDFEIKAKNTETKEFKQLCAVVQSFPTYKVKRRTIAKKEKKEAYKGLTYEYMERYIRFFSDDKTLKEYQTLRFVSECHSVRYPVIKQWFLERFPNIKQFGINEDFTALAEAI